ncbi:MAG: hypothetical protein ACP5T3_02845, partial [Candidatus Micrarchaeia archaeon]
MLALKVSKEHAEELRRYMRQKQLLDLKHRIISKGRFIYLPVTGI